MDGAIPGCNQEMETVVRGKARRSGVPCARIPLGTLTSNIWVSLLSRELQQLRQCKYWCLAASGGWFNYFDHLCEFERAVLVHVCGYSWVMYQTTFGY